MGLDPFIWFAIGLMTTFGGVLAWATWTTRGR